MTIGEWLAGIERERTRLTFDSEPLRVAAAEAVRGVPPDRLPLRLAKRRIELLHTCPRRAVAEAGTVFDPSSENFVIGRLVESAARMHLWDRYPVGDIDAVRTALIEHHAGRPDVLPELDDPVWETIAERADRFAHSWNAPPPSVDVHVGEQLVVPLARDEDGRPGVVLKGITDISIGTHLVSDPHRPRAILELKSGRTPWNPFSETHWYQFVVGAADGFAPHRVAIWAASPESDHPCGDIVDTPVTSGSLESATRWVCDALIQLGAIAAGEKPEERPSPMCNTCPDRESCPSARIGMSMLRGPHHEEPSFDAEDDDGEA